MTATDKPYRCPKCREPVDPTANECANCGLVFSKYVPPSARPPSTASGSVEVAKPRSGLGRFFDVFRPRGKVSESRYPALVAIALIYRIFALIALLGTGVVVLIALLTLVSAEGEEVAPTVSLFQVLVTGPIATITLLAVAELIQLLVDTEANMRGQA